MSRKMTGTYLDYSSKMDEAQSWGSKGLTTCQSYWDEIFFAENDTILEAKVLRWIKGTVLFIVEQRKQVKFINWDSRKTKKVQILLNYWYKNRERGKISPI